MSDISVPDKPIHLTLKKRAQLRRVIAGEPIGQASLAAGYSSASAGSRALRDTRAKLMEAMERYSLTDGVLVRDYLLPLLNATQTQHTSFMGSFTDSVTDEDNHIRLA